MKGGEGGTMTLMPSECRRHCVHRGVIHVQDSCSRNAGCTALFDKVDVHKHGLCIISSAGVCVCVCVCVYVRMWVCVCHSYLVILLHRA